MLAIFPEYKNTSPITKIFLISHFYQASSMQKGTSHVHWIYTNGSPDGRGEENKKDRQSLKRRKLAKIMRQHLDKVFFEIRSRVRHLSSRNSFFYRQNRYILNLSS